MKDSICQHCFNFNCSWHNEFKPVEGWKAISTEIFEIGKSYCVLECPEYKARANDFYLTDTYELSELCEISWRGFMRLIKRKPDKVKLMLLNKGYILKIDREPEAKYNRYYLQIRTKKHS